MLDLAVCPSTPDTPCALPNTAQSWIDTNALLACLSDPAFAEQPGTDRLLLLSTRFGQIFLSSASGSRAIASQVLSEDPWGGNLVLERRPLLTLLSSATQLGRAALHFDAKAGQLRIGEACVRATLMKRLT
jgi:hypothetical protein